MTDLAVLARGLDHPEGVCWHPDGRLFAGGEAGQLYQLGLDGAVEVRARTGGFVLGLALDAIGRLLACDAGRQELIAVDPTTGAVATVTNGAPRAPLRAPNQVAVHHTGRAYLTDSGTWGAGDGRVLCVEPDGQTRVWSHATGQFPNGCAVSADGRDLYVVESTLPGVSRVPIHPNGEAGQPQPVVRLPGRVPDGIAVAASGNLYLSCYRPDQLLRVSPAGAVAVIAEDPTGQLLNGPANLAFAGPRLDRLVVANLGGWHLSWLAPGEAGLPLPPRGGR